MKKILTTLIAVSMLASTSAMVYAEEQEVIEPNVSLEIEDAVIQGDIMLISEEANLPKYTSEDIEVSAVDGNEITKKAEDATKYNAENAVIFDLKGEKKTIADIKEGALLTLFFDTDNENALSFIVISEAEPTAAVTINKFAVSETLGDYVSEDESLAINLGEESVIVDLEGNALTEADIEGKYIAVFYSMTTMSIPPITSPDKVVVIEEADVEEEAVPVTELKIAADDVKEEDGIKMIPVRKYAESLELTVSWNGEDKSVKVGTVPMGVSFKIGENSYSKAKMMPFILECAPKLIDDTTYVPVSFFEQVLTVNVEITE